MSIVCSPPEHPMSQVFVPLVTVDIKPAKNAERPAIEMTTRTCQCPNYEVALIRAKWGRLHAETITERPLVDGANPLYELLSRDGLGVYETEEVRLQKKYGMPAFSSVYRDGELMGKIKECSASANEWLEAAHQKESEMQTVAAEKAAAALIKESGKAVAESYRQAEKRGRGRPRKVTQEPASADAQ